MAVSKESNPYEPELFQLGIESVEMRQSHTIEIPEVVRSIVAVLREDEEFWDHNNTFRPDDVAIIAIAAYILLP
jgi:hypothetical protein